MATLIKHVKGNRLVVHIPLQRVVRTITQDGVESSEEDFYPQEGEQVTVSLWGRYGIKIREYDAEVSGNVVTFEDDGTLSVNTYSIELLAKDSQGYNVRYKLDSAIQVVDATQDADVQAGVEFDAEDYTLDGAMLAIIKGEKGDPFAWDDMTQEQKEQFIEPIVNEIQTGLSPVVVQEEEPTQGQLVWVKPDNESDDPVVSLLFLVNGAYVDNIDVKKELAAHTNNAGIHVTEEDKSTWSAKYDKPEDGIPATDLDDAVQEGLSKADTSLQESQFDTVTMEVTYEDESVEEFEILVKKSGNGGASNGGE